MHQFGIRLVRKGEENMRKWASYVNYSSAVSFSVGRSLISSLICFKVFLFSYCMLTYWVLISVLCRLGCPPLGTHLSRLRPMMALWLAQLTTGLNNQWTTGPGRGLANRGFHTTVGCMGVSAVKFHLFLDRPLSELNSELINRY